MTSHIEPHFPVKTCKLSRCICQVLKYTGINIKMFKPHSVRVVSTSKVKNWVNLSAKFSKKFNGPKNQQNSIINIFRNNHFLVNIGAFNRGRRKHAFGDVRSKIERI